MVDDVGCPVSLEAHAATNAVDVTNPKSSRRLHPTHPFCQPTKPLTAPESEFRFVGREVSGCGWVAFGRSPRGYGRLLGL